MSQRPFTDLVFDLDDTLLDTSGLLIPQASLDACRAMISLGLKTDEATCVRKRTEIASHDGRADVFTALIEHFGVRDESRKSEIITAGTDAFYNRAVDQNLALMAGTREMLRDLRGRYTIHLVTAGQERTQNSKIEALKLRELCDSIHIVDARAGFRKGHAFKDIQERSGKLANQHLSIGNRLDSDIADAKRIGWQTCWVRYGEHAGDQPRDDFEKPDFSIDKIEELLTTCRL